MAQIGQGRVAGAEVIDGDFHPQLAQLAQLFAAGVQILHQRTFGDLHFQLLGCQLLFIQHPAQVLDQLRHAELHRADIQADHQITAVL